MKTELKEAKEERPEIGKNIAYWRKARGLSQGELAEFFNRKAAWLSMIEKGNRRVDAMDLYEIAQILRTPIKQFYSITLNHDKDN